MRNMQRYSLGVSLALISSLALLACDGGKEADQPAAPAPAEAEKAPAASGEKAEEKKDEKAGEKPADKAEAKDAEAGKAKPAIGNKPPKPKDQDKARAEAKRFADLLAQGRKAVKDKDLEGGMKHFRDALKIDPNHPGVLGELGWAAFQAKDYSTARAATETALIYVRKPKRKGALLYNLGRVSEAQGRKDVALAHYKHSLTLRDNEIVAKRAAKLESERAAGGPEFGAAAAGEGYVPGPAKDNCKDALEHTFCTWEGSECECDVHKELRSTVEGSSMVEAAVLSVHGPVEGMGHIDEGALWIRTTTGGWQAVATVGDGSAPGVSYIQNHYTIDRLEFAQVFPGGDEELILEVHQTSSDGEYSDNYVEIDETITRWLCVTTGGAASCYVIPLSEVWATEQLLDDGPKPPSDVPLGETAWAWSVTASGDKLKFVAENGEDKLGEKAKLLGEQSLETVGANPEIEVIPLL